MTQSTAKSKKQWKIALQTIRQRTLNHQDELLHECRRALLASKFNWTAVGREAGVNGQTIKKLAYSDTIRPQFVTVLAVLAALEYEITIAQPKGGVQTVLAKRPTFLHRVDRARKQITQERARRRVA